MAGLTQKDKSALDRFKRASSLAVPRIIWSSGGEPGSGKTHFGLTAPGPIVVQSLNLGLEGVVEQFQEHKEIRVVDYDWAPTDDTFTQEDAVKLRDQFIDDFVFAVEHARTVIWDLESEVWELFRYAEFGGPSDRPNNFSQLNQRMRKYVNLPKKATINFGCIQSLKDEWVSITKANGKAGGEATGNRKRAGFKELEGLVHVDLFHERRAGHFNLTVGKSRGPGCRNVQDQTFSDIDFSTLGQLIFPDTESENWE